MTCFLTTNQQSVLIPTYMILKCYNLIRHIYFCMRLAKTSFLTHTQLCCQCAGSVAFLCLHQVQFSWLSYWISSSPLRHFLLWICGVHDSSFLAPAAVQHSLPCPHENLCHSEIPFLPREAIFTYPGGLIMPNFVTSQKIPMAPQWHIPKDSTSKCVWGQLCESAQHKWARSSSHTPTNKTQRDSCELN